MSTIAIKNLTKDYGSGCGVFDINLSIEKGEMMGFIGTNGSGKTTTIRNIMGFLKPTNGACYVNSLESWKYASEICKHIGYVPGEIAFPDLKTGVEFLKCQQELLHLKSMDYANELISLLQLDPSANLKRMSKGMKQKTALVAALMSDPEIIILDEPTTGLDPLMREVFLKIIEEEHKKGKTIFMSSHMFEELQKTCDRVSLISNGHLVDTVSMSVVKNPLVKEYKIEFLNPIDFVNFSSTKEKGEFYNIIRTQEEYNQVTIDINIQNSEMLLELLRNYELKYISEIPFTLESYFNKKILNNQIRKE